MTPALALLILNNIEGLPAGSVLTCICAQKAVLVHSVSNTFPMHIVLPIFHALSLL